MMYVIKNEDGKYWGNDSVKSSYTGSLQNAQVWFKKGSVSLNQGEQFVEVKLVEVE